MIQCQACAPYPILGPTRARVQESDNPSPASFNLKSLKIPDEGVRKVRGQVLYMPVYSNLPYREDRRYDLSALLAVHNTDLTHQIRITKVIIFNTDGQAIRDFIIQDHLLNPLATAFFEIPKKRSEWGKC
jgi:hypothetical protein